MEELIKIKKGSGIIQEKSRKKIQKSLLHEFIL
jgi:hypothetical protein